MRPTRIQKLQELRDAAAFKRASFGAIGGFGEPPLPKTEYEVTAFIVGRTELYLNTYVLARIDRMIEQEKRRRETTKKCRQRKRGIR